MFNVIQNPDLSSLVHCFKAPDLSIVFGDVSEQNVNDNYTLNNLEEFFTLPQDHSSYIFYVDKSKTEDLFNELTDDSLIDAITEAGENGLVCVYYGQEKDLVILLETHQGLASKEHLEKNKYFGHDFYYIEHFFATCEMFSGEDETLLKLLNHNEELFEFFCNIDIYKD